MYLSEGISDAIRIKDALSRGESVSGVYCICVKNYGNNLMEIIYAKEAVKKQYSGGRYLVIGLADGKLESFELVEEIIKDYYMLNKNLNGFRESFWQGGYAWVL